MRLIKSSKRGFVKKKTNISTRITSEKNVLFVRTIQKIYVDI